MSKNHFVLWSGGFDSTYLITYLLDNQLVDSNELHLISINHNLTGEVKHKREAKCREKILQYLKDKYPRIKFDCATVDTTVTYDVSKTISTENNRGLSQPIIWVSQFIPLIPSNSKIYMGYILGDDAANYCNQIKEIIKLNADIQEKKNIDVVFPLRINHDKSAILHNLRENHVKLLNLCTSCEELYNEKNDKCGQCKPCKHIKLALIDLILNGEDWVKLYLRKWFNLQIDLSYIEPEKKKEVRKLNGERTINKSK